jgi:hypothetical protein
MSNKRRVSDINEVNYLPFVCSIVKLIPPRKLRIPPKSQSHSRQSLLHISMYSYHNQGFTLVVSLSLHSRVLVAPLTYNSRYEGTRTLVCWRNPYGRLFTVQGCDIKERISEFEEDAVS